MTQEQFNQMKEVLEFDLGVYLATMINSRKFNSNQILEMGAYVGAHYTHFSESQNFTISETDKCSIKEYICSFYNQSIRHGISEIEKNILRKKYDELLNTDKSIISEYLERITKLAVH